MNFSAICPDTSFHRDGGLLKYEVFLSSEATPVLQKEVRKCGLVDLKVRK